MKLVHHGMLVMAVARLLVGMGFFAYGRPLEVSLFHQELSGDELLLFM